VEDGDVRVAGVGDDDVRPSIAVQVRGRNGRGRRADGIVPWRPERASAVVEEHGDAARAHLGERVRGHEVDVAVAVDVRQGDEDRAGSGGDHIRLPEGAVSRPREDEHLEEAGEGDVEVPVAIEVGERESAAIGGREEGRMLLREVPSRLLREKDHSLGAPAGQVRVPIAIHVA
jgi:hypothetical protein